MIVATNGGEEMVANKGRTQSKMSKDYMLRVRMDKDTLQKLDEHCKKENITRSEAVRRCIEELCKTEKK